MRFIEMTGKTLKSIVDREELHVEDLEKAGVTDVSIVRVNEQGDIEVRRTQSWDVIGGLIGSFDVRVKTKTGLDWA